MRGAIKSHPFGTQVPRKVRHACRSGAILLLLSPLQQFLIAEEKDRLARRAQQDAIKNAKKQAIDTLQELQTLEQQRETIMGKLQEAQNNVVRFAQPEANPDDLAQLAKIPETPEEELDTLVNVADAVINSNIKIGTVKKLKFFSFFF